MSTDSRRSPRLIDYLPLEVRVLHGPDGRCLAGPFAGRIIDISRHGACLLMSQVMQNTFHVFHSTRESDEAVLQLSINLSPDDPAYLLLARPVWLALFAQEKIRAFKMGVEFTEDPEKQTMRRLREAIQVNQGQRAGWWQRHCHSFKRGSFF
ncbi:PilZ domain-containing protein [Desulfobulbus propionicus]|jgi:hypothetical protein